MTTFYLPSTYVAECELAMLLRRLQRSKGINRDKLTPVTTGLDKDQPNAVAMACTEPLSILCGSPGTGKTTTLERIVDSFQSAGLQGMVLAPTGKAGKRADEVINRKSKRPTPIPCQTIHRGLHWNFGAGEHGQGGFSFNEHEYLDIDYLIIEESSMGDLHLMRDTMLAVNPTRTRVLFCGDPYQLPSVDPGNVLHDMISSRVIPTTNLQHVFRQGADSGIAINAQRIMRGEGLLKHDPRTGELFSDFFFVPKPDELSTVNTIVSYASDKIPTQRKFDPLMEIQVASPGKKSICGAVNLNKALREKMNPGKDVYRNFRKHDKVIQRQNMRQLGIVNGDCGKILEISDQGCTVDFGPGAGNNESGIVEMSSQFMGHLTHGYCATVHFLQGSEVKAILIPLHKCHTRLLFRNLIYTGITRGKELTVLLGDPLALARCLSNSTTDKRITNLQALLRSY